MLKPVVEKRHKESRKRREVNTAVVATSSNTPADTHTITFLSLNYHSAVTGQTLMMEMELLATEKLGPGSCTNRVTN